MRAWHGTQIFYKNIFFFVNLYQLPQDFFVFGAFFSLFGLRKGFFLPVGGYFSRVMSREANSRKGAFRVSSAVTRSRLPIASS